jgi:tetratricopeptide (TPR) repeat protein
LVLEAWKRSALKSTHPDAGPSFVTIALVFVIPLVAMLASSTASTNRVLAYGIGSPKPHPVVQAQIAHHLGDQAARTGDENAPRLFSLAFQLDPNPVYARRAGEAWRLAGEKDKALQEFTNAIERDSLDIVSLGQRGFLWLYQGDASRAERDFNAVLRIAPGNVRSIYGLGLVARLQNNSTLERTHMEEVVRRTEEELKQRPETSGLLSNLGHALYYLGRYDEAITELNKALAIAPDRSGDWSTLGDCYRSVSQFEAAERAYQKASQLRSRGPAGRGAGDLR